MQSIYKYPIRIEESEQILILPGIDPKPLAFQLQDGVPTVWIMVNFDSLTKTEWVLDIIGTGWNMEQEFFSTRDYIGTIQDNGLDWHLFISKKGRIVNFDKDRLEPWKKN